MRAPFQILAIPYRMVDGEVQYGVLHRADHDQWQFIAGGGEDDECPEAAAVREIWEESGVEHAPVIRLTSMCYIPTNIFKDCGRQYGWPADRLRLAVLSRCLRQAQMGFQPYGAV